MFPTYNSLAEVPEPFREHYVMKGGKAVAEVSPDHPLVTNNATLLSEKTTAEEKLRTAETERDTAKAGLASAQASSLPRGHRAVPVADAELVDVVKAAGVTTADAFKTLHTEHGDYKTKAEVADKAAHAAAVGEAMGWDKEKTALLVPAVFDLSTVELRDGTDGKKTPVAKVKQADNTFVERPFADVIKTTAPLSALLPSLTPSHRPDGTPLPEHGAGGGGSSRTAPVDSYLSSVDAPPKSRQAQA